MITAGTTGIDFTPHADGQNNTVTAQVKDPADNASAEGSDSAMTNTAAIAAAVTAVTSGGAAADG